MRTLANCGAGRSPQFTPASLSAGDACIVVTVLAASADAVILSQILHDWDDERAAAILDGCRQALSPGGRLVLVEGVVPDGPEADFLKLLDLHMLVLLGGKERTETEWRDLLTISAFRLANVLPSRLIAARAD
jgi:SAM-dependent methyltransferase